MCSSALFVSSCTLVCKQCVINANISRPMEWKPLVILAKSLFYGAYRLFLLALGHLGPKTAHLNLGHIEFLNDSDYYGPQVSLLWNKGFFIDLRDLSTKFENVLFAFCRRFWNTKTLKRSTKNVRSCSKVLKEHNLGHVYNRKPQH